MNEYIASYRKPNGQKVTESLDAESADEAMAEFQKRGYDVVMHTSDSEALYRRPKEVVEAMTPGEYIWSRSLLRLAAALIYETIDIYQITWKQYILVFFCIFLLAYLDTQLWILFAITTGFLAAPMIFAIYIHIFSKQRREYYLLIDAFAWGRWQEVLDRADVIQSEYPLGEITVRKACALAQLGRIEEALEHVVPLQRDTTIPKWMYSLRLGEIYAHAKQYENTAMQLERAFHLAPNNATVLLDNALFEIQRCRNVTKASKFLERARQQVMSGYLISLNIYIEGLIVLEEGHAEESYSLLKSAHEKMSHFRHVSGLIFALLDLIRAYMAIAAANMGDLRTAQKHYRRALPRLKALKKIELIERCEQAMGKL